MNKNRRSILSDKRLIVQQSRLNNIKQHNWQQSGLEEAITDIIKLGLKTKGAIKYLEQDILMSIQEGSSIREKAIRKGNKKSLNQSMVKGVEAVHEGYFVPQLQIPSKDSIDVIMDHKRRSKTMAVRTEQSMLPMYLNKQNDLLPSDLSKEDALQVKVMPTTFDLMQSRVGTLRSTENSCTKQNNRSTGRNMEKWEDSAMNRKRSNTFLFPLPTTKPVPRKKTIVDDKVFPWEEGLLEVINSITGTSIKVKQNAKVSREKLSAYLNSHFLNETLTNYYNLQAFEHFHKLRSIVEDLQTMPKKEANILAFFTYDINGDGFICQEDLYHFLQCLSYTAPIVQDIHCIINFLRKNQVRSNKTNLPRKILERKQKVVVYQMWKDHSVTQLKKSKMQQNDTSKRFFSLCPNSEDEKEKSGRQTMSSKAKQKHLFRKFQINFDVFNLIFADRKPLLIQQMLKKLTEPPSKKIASRKPDVRSTTKTEPTEQFLYTRSQQWKNQMNISQVLKFNAKMERKTLSYKL